MSVTRMTFAFHLTHTHTHMHNHMLTHAHFPAEVPNNWPVLPAASVDANPEHFQRRIYLVHVRIKTSTKYNGY